MLLGIDYRPLLAIFRRLHALLVSKTSKICVPRSRRFTRITMAVVYASYAWKYSFSLNSSFPSAFNHSASSAMFSCQQNAITISADYTGFYLSLFHLGIWDGSTLCILKVDTPRNLECVKHFKICYTLEFTFEFVTPWNLKWITLWNLLHHRIWNGSHFENWCTLELGMGQTLWKLFGNCRQSRNLDINFYPGWDLDPRPLDWQSSMQTAGPPCTKQINLKKIMETRKPVSFSMKTYRSNLERTTFVTFEFVTPWNLISIPLWNL